MIKKTVVVIGPGGIGKSPLDHLFSADIRIDPYRLRPKGPDKNKDDIFYCHPRLKNELSSMFEQLRIEKRNIGYMSGAPVEWFPQGRTLFFKVRKEYQVLILIGMEGDSAKAELYAPLLPILLSQSDLAMLLGEVDILFLNPLNQTITTMSDYIALAAATEANCCKRGDSNEDARSRAASVSEEAPVWKTLVTSYGATEYTEWPFPEFRYRKLSIANGLLERQKRLLKQAREYLLTKNKRIESVLKLDREIDAISDPILQ